MTDPIRFDTDLYPREVLESVAAKYSGQAHIRLAEAGDHLLAHVEAPAGPDAHALCDAFRTEAFSAAARRLRELAPGARQRAADPADVGPPWQLLNPLEEGDALALGWVLESLSPIRAGAATMVLRHPDLGSARVAIHRNGGTPIGIAHTDHLDFMLMNGGSGSAQTEGSIEVILTALAEALRASGNGGVRADLVDALLPHGACQPPGTNGAAATTEAGKRVVPRIDLGLGAVSFEFAEAGIDRLALYDALLRFAERCYVFVERVASQRIVVQVRPRGDVSSDGLRALAAEVTRALNQALRGTGGGRPAGGDRHEGLPPLARRRVDLGALLAELAAADPTTLGLGAQPERGPGHQNLRVLNVRGTGACNSECVFCIEKFNPTHRPMPSADATRQLIVESAGRYDMLFFASGEPTIHPKLFDYVALAREMGFTCFGMSSHFRTFSDPQFALQTLQAGFEYFDIALHAADLSSQLDVNPIGDDGQSLYEALKGLAVLLRLSDVLGIRISITHKIVVSRLNVTQLEPIFRATYDRGVRHFILQPVRSMGLAPALQAKLEISEEEILPHLNDLLRATEGLGAVVKPYGFSRQNLFSGGHVETEQNRVKNIYGKARQPEQSKAQPVDREARPRDGRHWVQVQERVAGQLLEYGFPSDGSAPILDDALSRGRDLNFGCRMGSCGMCCARLLEGRVDQSTQIFLTDEQIAAGFVLLCQARPLSDVVVQACTNDEIDQL